MRSIDRNPSRRITAMQAVAPCESVYGVNFRARGEAINALDVIVQRGDEVIEPDVKLRDQRDKTEQRQHCALVRHPRPFREIPLRRVAIEIFTGSSLRMKRYFAQLFTKLHKFFHYYPVVYIKIARNSILMNG